MKAIALALVLVILICVSSYAIDHPVEPFVKAKALAMSKGKTHETKHGTIYLLILPKGSLVFNPSKQDIIISVGDPKNTRAVTFMGLKDGNRVDAYFVNRTIDGKSSVEKITWSTAYDLANDYLKELGE